MLSSSFPRVVKMVVLNRQLRTAIWKIGQQKCAFIPDARPECGRIALHTFFPEKLLLKFGRLMPYIPGPGNVFG